MTDSAYGMSGSSPPLRPRLVDTSPPLSKLGEAALEYSRMGWPIFPVEPRGKQPLVKNWQSVATTDPEQVLAWWHMRPDANIGYPVRDGEVVVDVDGPTDAEIPPTLRSLTAKGSHNFYETDREIRQGVRIAQNIDTRTAGKGFVVLPPSVHASGHMYAWDPAGPKDRAPAPEWLYDAQAASRDELTFTVHDPAYVAAEAGEVRWGDNAMASEAGRLASMGLGIGAIADALEAKHAVHQNGQPYDYVRDCLRVARSVHAKEHRDHPERYPSVPADPRPDGMDAVDLLALELPPLRQAFVGLIPEGLGVLASPPKAGKSLLCYQAAVELVFGGVLLGRQGERRPVLYYALEDGKLRSQTRIRNVVGSRRLSRGLDLRWTAPRLGGPLEAEIDGWLAAHPLGVVFIDVLSKVRPSGRAGLNAYDEDYNALNGIHGVAKAHPGSTIVLVTHDRKAGSDDWMTKVTGTRGVTGVADFAIFIDRKRGSDTGWIHVTGRDLPDDSLDVTFSGEGWRLTDVVQLIGAKSPTRQAIYGWLREHGPAYPKAIAEGTGLAIDVVRHRVQDMVDAGDLRPVPTGYVVASDEPDAGMTGHDG